MLVRARITEINREIVVISYQMKLFEGDRLIGQTEFIICQLKWHIFLRSLFSIQLLSVLFFVLSKQFSNNILSGSSGSSKYCCNAVDDDDDDEVTDTTILETISNLIYLKSISDENFGQF